MQHIIGIFEKLSSAYLLSFKADTYRNGQHNDFVFTDMKFCILNRIPYRFGKTYSLIERNIRYEHRKLFTAVSVNGTAGRHIIFEQSRDLFDDSITRSIVMHIVNHLEVIDID